MSVVPLPSLMPRFVASDWKTIRRPLALMLGRLEAPFPVPPLEGIWCAVERMTRDGKQLGGDQRVDVATALAGYTSQAAHLGFEEQKKGTLEPGKLADVAVLSHDPVSVEPPKLRDIEVETTIVGGDVVWSRQS